MSTCTRVFFLFCLCLVGSIGSGSLAAAQTAPSDPAGATAGTFGVTPSGSASYAVPIAVPPGTTGVQPKLTLQYSSNAGNGALGMGISVGGLSFITRCPTTLYQDSFIDPVDYDANDRFCLNGERLVPISGTYGADSTEYRTSFEEFSKIVSYGAAGSGPEKFKVWKKSGEILEYGYTADARIEATGRADVRVWALNRLEDRAGNYIAFAHTEDTASGDSSAPQIL